LSRVSHEQVEEFYVLTWESPKEMIFEMPVRVSSRARLFGCSRRRLDRRRSINLGRLVFLTKEVVAKEGTRRLPSSSAMIAASSPSKRERLDRSSDASRVSRSLSRSRSNFFLAANRERVC